MKDDEIAERVLRRTRVAQRTEQLKQLSQLKQSTAQEDRASFAEDVIKDTFEEAGRQCMCEYSTCEHGHSPNRCAANLRWEDRGYYSEPGKWQADHKDGDRSNNDPKNCQILCSPCHEDKTEREREDT